MILINIQFTNSKIINIMAFLPEFKLNLTLQYTFLNIIVASLCVKKIYLTFVHFIPVNFWANII